MADDPRKIEERKEDEAQEVPSIHEAPAAVLGEGSLDPVYEAKAKLLNKAIQDIGMGRYQWQVKKLSLTNHTRISNSFYPVLSFASLVASQSRANNPSFSS